MCQKMETPSNYFFNMEDFTIYNCKHILTNGDKSEFVKTLFKRSQFLLLLLLLLLRDLWLNGPEFDNILAHGKHCESMATKAMNESCKKMGRL